MADLLMRLLSELLFLSETEEVMWWDYDIRQLIDIRLEAVTYHDL